MQRWITAAVAVPVILVVIIYGNEAVFALFITVLALIGLAEYNKMALPAEKKSEKLQVLAAGFLIMASAYAGGIDLLIALVTLTVIGVFAAYLLQLRKSPESLDSPVKVVFGALYIALMMSYFILLRAEEQGRTWIFFLIVLAFANDVSAFYVGRTWGRRKLSPHVSAGKTVEGSIGGIAGAMIVCVAFCFLFLKDVPLYHAAVIGFFGSILGQMGDLCESIVKRVSMVKDSGSVLPGHGGVLDRLDAFLFIAPFVYYYKMLIL